MNELLILLGAVALWAAANITYASWKWNHGTCRKNGIRWRHFDTDSHGDLGYVAGGEVWWNAWPTFSWPNIRHEPRPTE